MDIIARSGSPAQAHDAAPSRRGLAAADIYQLTRQHRYGVLVVTERRDGTIVSQTYSSLASAGRKLDRVRERGLVARAVLVELRAVADAAIVLGDA